MIRAGTALIIFGKIHFLLISENEFFYEIKRDGITSLQFMLGPYIMEQTTQVPPSYLGL